MSNIEIVPNKSKSDNSGEQDEIFGVIGSDKINKFFKHYRQFDELGLCVIKEKSSLIYSDHILLDGEVSGKLYSNFHDAFLDSIKSIVGEDLFIRMGKFFKEKDYLLSNEHKKSDSDPYLDDKFQVILLGDDTVDNTVAQLIERRNTFNNVEFHYIVYPNRIFSFIDKLCKEHHINSNNLCKQSEIFDVIGSDTTDNDTTDDFFENYKQFDEHQVIKDKNVLIYSNYLDTEVSSKTRSDFREAFENSIKGIVGEEIFKRIKEVSFEEKDYLLSNREKMFDNDPYLDDKLQIILLGDDTVAQFIERRNTFNKVEFHYIVYPNRIFSYIDDLCKKNKIKI